MNFDFLGLTPMKRTCIRAASLFPEYTGLKITRIKLYRADLPLHEGRYTWAGGKYGCFRSSLSIQPSLSGLS